MPAGPAGRIAIDGRLAAWLNGGPDRHFSEIRRSPAIKCGPGTATAVCIGENAAAQRRNGRAFTGHSAVSRNMPDGGPGPARVGGETAGSRGISRTTGASGETGWRDAGEPKEGCRQRQETVVPPMTAWGRMARPRDIAADGQKRAHKGGRRARPARRAAGLGRVIPLFSLVFRGPDVAGPRCLVPIMNGGSIRGELVRLRGRPIGQRRGAPDLRGKNRCLERKSLE